MSSSLARLLTPKRLVIAFGTLILIAFIAFVVEGVLAAYAMNAARADGNAVAASLTAGDLAGANTAAAKLEKDAQRAHSYTNDPLWWIGSHVPFLGQNVAAVQDSATALDAIANHSLPVLLTLAGEVEHGSLRPQGGRISPSAIAHFAPEVRQAANALDGPATTVEQINVSSLLPGLSSLMGEVQDRITQAKTAIDAAANAFEVLPTMLGGHGPRTYLLIVQNPAEIRSGGGLPGTWALIHANDGRLTMTKTAFLNELGQTTLPIPITSEESAIFGSNWGLNPADATETPDFPRTAQMATAIEARRGVHVSAVFSVDPVALAYVLRGTGPVTLQPGIQLNADNAVWYLMNGLYLHLANNQTANDTFSLAAHRTFDALVHGQGNQVSAIRGLVDAVLRHRVFAWSSDPTVSRVIDAENLTGGFPTDTGASPQVGVYLNEGIVGKPDYYLRQSSAVTATGCSNGVQTLRLQTSFQSTMPSNAAGTLSFWVVGTGEYAPQGDMLLDVYIAGPWHGSVDTLTINGQQQSVTYNTLQGRQLAETFFNVSPGELVTIVATMHTGPGQTGSGKLLWTPGMSTDLDPSTFSSAC